VTASAQNVQAFLDETPGEVRGIISVNDRYQHLIIRRDDDPVALCLGARSVGRVRALEPAYGGAFVELPAAQGRAGAPSGFLKLGQTRLTQGQAVEVEVTSEVRQGKQVALRLIGPAEGPPRLMATGPTVQDWLEILAPGVPVQTGWQAIQASWDAEEEARQAGNLFADTGLDVSVQRTRALVSVDIDHVNQEVGQGHRAPPARNRDAVNREGLALAARMIRLNGWGGLVVIDFAGTRLNAEALTQAAKKAFAEPQAVFGPFSRFGVLQLSLPWRMTPLDDRLAKNVNGNDRKAEAIALVRQLRHALLTQTSVPRFVARAHPGLAEAAAALVAKLGPRAHIQSDPGQSPGNWQIGEL
jgi:Ribonucleases G and E